MNTEQQFLQALEDSFNQYQQFGARSNKKLIPIHSWLAKIIIDNLDDTFKIHSLGYSKEIKLLGKYYQKTLDIAITKLAKILNSERMFFYIQQTSRDYQGGYKSYAKSFIENFCITSCELEKIYQKI